MATYYVRTDGSNGNAGTGSTTGQAWQTVTYALANMVLTSGTNYLYIAPGVYRESPTVTVTPSVSQTLVISGDPTASQFMGVTPNIVLITNFATDNVVPTFGNVLTCSKTYVTLQNVHIVGNGYTQFSSARNITLQNCVFSTYAQVSGGSRGTVRLATSSNNPLDSTISKCIFYGDVGLFIEGQTTGSTYNFNTSVSDCLFLCNSGLQVDGPSYNTITVGNGVSIYNSTFLHQDIGVSVRSSNATNTSNIRNCVLFGIYGGTSLSANTTGRLIEDFNRFASASTRLGVDVGTNSRTGLSGLDLGATLLSADIPTAIFSPYLSSPLIAGGTSSGAPVTDIYSDPWTSGTDIGAFARTSFAGTSFYYPTERNASAITIAPGSTSQSIELYLGATGLTASTTGLSARYNRTRTASVSIPLVARTIAQAWTAGGFAEVDATNMPGVYRLDLPDAALAAGADDVTVVVRGASGTNGAVMTVKLSSGGLTSAQTASAVWGESVAGYVAETDFGGVVNATRNVVGGIETSVQDIPQTVWDEPKANHTIPNTFGDYLDTKVSTGADTSRIQLRQGPFLIKQNATEGLITEVNQFLSTVPNLEIVLIDSSGGAVSVAGSTLVLRVRNQAGTAVVNNVTPTVAYADGGVIRWTPNLSWNALSVTTPGTYRIIVERTMGTTTTTFGPFLVQLSSG